MKIDKEYLKSIKPKQRFKSDKYSWNIYRYLKKNMIFGDIKVLDTSFGIMFCYNMDKVGFSGRTIHSILQSGPYSALDNYCYLRYYSTEYKDISDEFFKKYSQVGRCYFDEDHNGWWSGDEHRFTDINRNCKRCNWCGKDLRRTIETVVERKRKEVWRLEK